MTLLPPLEYCDGPITFDDKGWLLIFPPCLHRENNRATLVGERTFGKGVIQTVEPLNSGGGVAVTVARRVVKINHNRP